MRYLLALGVTVLVTGASLAYHAWVTASITTIAEQARQRAGLPRETPLNDFGIELSARQMLYIQLDDFLLRFWFVLLPLGLLICFGIAATLGRTQAGAGPPAAVSERS